jgi:hypothetical protein
MLLIEEAQRLDSRSTAEMTVDELARLRATLESSEAIGRIERAGRPRRGGVIFGFVPLLLLYMLMESRRTTYRGAVRNLSDRDCACLGLPLGSDGRHRRPSAATLNGFANHALAEAAEEIGREVSAAALAAMDSPVVTLDSTPLQASRYNFDADYSPHYEIRMYKAHMAMADGFPVAMIHSGGNAHDNPFAAPLVEGLCRARRGIWASAFHADGQYDAFLTYAHVYVRTGAVMRCNQGVDAVRSGVDADRIAEEYARMWREKGYDPHRKGDLDFMLRFLHRHGKGELVGMHLRDRSMGLDAAEEGAGGRHVCETVHRAMKRWMAFDAFRVVRRTMAARMRCRFLCLQLLATLFKGYAEG